MYRDDVQPSPIEQELLGKKLEDAVFCKSEKRLVICVIGEGGVGKATLVRELYEKPATKSNQFEKAWVSFQPYLRSSSIIQLIHHEFEELIYQELMESYLELKEKDIWYPRKYVEEKLLFKKLLGKNRFLLVIDGEVSNSDWNAILDALPDGEVSNSDPEVHKGGNRIVRIMQGIHKRPRSVHEWIELKCFDKEKTSSLFKQTVCMEEKIKGSDEGLRCCPAWYNQRPSPCHCSSVWPYTNKGVSK